MNYKSRSGNVQITVSAIKVLAFEIVGIPWKKYGRTCKFRKPCFNSESVKLFLYACEPLNKGNNSSEKDQLVIFWDLNSYKLVKIKY